MSEIVNKIKTLVEPILSDLGLSLFDVEFDGKSLVILIDNEQHNIDLDSCVQASNAISAMLDIEDPLPGEYVLEVASPGVERPLSSLEDFSKAKGMFIEVELENAVYGGELLEVNPESILLAYKVKSLTKKIKIDLNSIKNAKTTVNI